MLGSGFYQLFTPEGDGEPGKVVPVTRESLPTRY